MNESLPQSSGDPSFATTRWSVVLAAGNLQDKEGQAALATLCRIYWFPVYAFIRRRGNSAVDSQDLTQEFFSRLLDKRYLDDADPNRGRFRAFLLTMVKHFLSNQRERAMAAKRGGGMNVLPIDANISEHRYQLQSSDDVTAEQIFERQWALSLLQHAIERLGDDYAKDGKKALFDRILTFLIPSTDNPSYGEIGTDLGMSEGAIKMAVQRLRQRYRDLLRQEIASTLVAGDSLDDEINRLLRALKS